MLPSDVAMPCVQVLKNELGAVAGTSQAFSLTPPPATGLGATSPTFTASKVMLAKEETQMNMLTPLKREAVVQVRPRSHTRIPEVSSFCVRCCLHGSACLKRPGIVGSFSYLACM